MTGYLIRRLLQMIVVTILVAIATYYLFSIAPGGPLTGLQQQQQQLTREDIARLRAQYELDLYWPVRFLRWFVGFPSGPIVIGGQEVLADLPVGCYLPSEQGIGCDDFVYLSELPTLHPAVRSSRGILRGDFGPSTVITPGRPVMDLIRSRIRPTLELMLTALFFSLLLGLPIGIYSAVRQYSRFDYIFTTLAFIGSSMPVFFFGLLLILAFSVMPIFLQDTIPWIPRLPPGSREAIRPYEIASWLPRIEGGSLADRLLHLLMPVSVLTLLNMATWSRFVRSSMLEVLRQDYVRTARAKGLVERVVISKHALRNALIPFVTILVLQIPGVFAGAIITETVFSWNGTGFLYVDALNRSDWPVALAFIFITAVLTVIATLIGDILYTVVDPRIRYS
ncbi:MAG: ABC transporter permease [Caldilineaceae bacterium]